ncbi:MAG: chemotaxis protein CheA [Oscillospiraceae bacterium]|nr:chemotaxis protein CheA [Oscillospiraceae bacterium]
MDSSMVEVFIYESEQLLESLEEILLQGEKEHKLSEQHINEVFRVMHTFKGSASMMEYMTVAHLAHAVEDLFDQIRSKGARDGDWAEIFDIVLTANDMLKTDIAEISNGLTPTSNSEDLINKVHVVLEKVKSDKASDDAGVAAAAAAAAASTAPVSSLAGGAAFDDPDAPYYRIKVIFDDGCQMENLRALSVVTELAPYCLRAVSVPEDLEAPDATADIVSNGFVMFIQTNENPDVLKQIANGVMYVKTASVLPIEDLTDLPEGIRPVKPTESSASEAASDSGSAPTEVKQAGNISETVAKQNFISVNVNKLDKLMDLVGEIVTNESMVTKHPDIVNLQIQSFEKSSQQLHKLINELQDIVMSIRMVPVATTFHKMQRIVRDMSKKVEKDVDLIIIGEETEVDKSIIDTLSDPLMHLIRNSVDHGLESAKDRIAKGKTPKGRVTLEARNTGGDVIIIVEDDGGGLDRAKIYKKAFEKGLTSKSEAEMTDKEVYQLIFAAGLSTNEVVTEFSGRGVGMDVVRSNIDKVGGSISVESAPDVGTTITIRIPLTLAIIEGMKLRTGRSVYIAPMLSIQESFKADMKDVFLDPDGAEMIMIRKEVYPIIRLYRLFNLEPEYTDLTDGILIMINSEQRTYCLFVDELIGEQQAVIKPLPTYIQKHNEGIHGLSGCSILGDGSISLIIDINNLILE